MLLTNIVIAQSFSGVVGVSLLFFHLLLLEVPAVSVAAVALVIPSVVVVVRFSHRGGYLLVFSGIRILL